MMLENKSEFGDQLLSFRRAQQAREAKAAGVGEMFDAFGNKKPTAKQAAEELARRVEVMERDHAALAALSKTYEQSKDAAYGLLYQLVMSGVLVRNTAHDLGDKVLTVAGPSDDVCVFVLVPKAKA